MDGVPVVHIALTLLTAISEMAHAVEEETGCRAHGDWQRRGHRC